MAAPRFTRFVMFAAMRTGSNFLEANLNAMPGVACLGEVFNPVFIGKQGQTGLFGVTLAERTADPLRLLARMQEHGEGLTGFRFFHDHDPRVLTSVMEDRACAKIILTRNPVESYVSLKIAQATGQWKLTNAKNLKTAQIEFDARGFERHLRELQEFQMLLLHGLQISGQTAFYIDYEDIGDIDVLNGLARFLGVQAKLAAPDGTLKKQNPEEIAEKVMNPAEMEAALARLDRFNLSRTPNFEPRRPPAIPSFVAARGAPLLYMPVRSGPEEAGRNWLGNLESGGLGSGGLIEDFVQKSLRHWKRAHLGHRSFTVVRHPLLRAHVAFRALILSGRLAEHRATLIRAHRAELPPPGQAFADAEAHRTAFLAFLHYAKLSVQGKAGEKVDPSWASQTAVIQGFAGFQGPDLVIREDRLAEGLAYLAAEVGFAAPAVAGDARAAAVLAAIHDPSLDAAAEEAYPRDFIGHGWGPWQA